MPGSLSEREREAAELFAHAEGRLPLNHSVRKHALAHAIKLAHSPHTSLKRLAAMNIAKFFKAFPDLEEDAINAIYDLCEDQDPNIRIEGYKAVVRMSEEQPRWVERNVDVLVQLLQSDEPAEVAVVKTALIQHLELDSKITLSVLCDQIVPPDDPTEDEDKVIRERLRALVVAFLAEDARKPLLMRLQGQGESGVEQEQALIGTLLKAVSKYGGTDAAKITKDILVFLPSFNGGRPTRRGNELLQVLLVWATSSLKEDLAPKRNPASLERCRGYLELCNFLCREKGVSDPVRLLRFYCTPSLMGKMTLGRLSQDARLFFIVHLAQALAASHRMSPESAELASMRRQIVDALTVILPFFIQIAPLDAQAWRSCETLLQTCQQRKGEQPNWNISAPLHSVLVEITHLADEKQNPESKRVGDLSRSLTRPASHPSSLPAKPLTSPPPIPEISILADVTFNKRKAGEEEPGVSQEREGAQRLSIRGQHARQRRQSVGSGASSPASTAEDGVQQSAMKRLKVATDDETPSLLLRMGHVQRLSPGARSRQASKSKSPPVLQPPRSDSPRHLPTGSLGPTLGLSIKGAARSHSHSLLERIQGDGT